MEGMGAVGRNEGITAMAVATIQKTGASPKASRVNALLVPVETTPTGKPKKRSLSKRQVMVLQYSAQGLTVEEIGKSLSLAGSTVRTHLRTIYKKLGVRNKTEAFNKGRALNLF
jgi:ATP/maltotriose-dependent transcriptional regulator MalT